MKADDGVPSKVGANATAPPDGGDDAKAGGLRDNLRMSDAMEAWEKAGLIRTGTRAHELLSQYCKLNVAYSYCKGHDEGRAAIDKTFAGGTNTGWSPGGDIIMTQMMDGLSSEEERAECLRARTEGFLHAAGIVITEVVKMPNEDELKNMCKDVKYADNLRKAGKIKTPEDLQGVLKVCQEQASKSDDKKMGHNAIFAEAKLLTRDLRRQVKKHVSCWRPTHDACNLDP